MPGIGFLHRRIATAAGQGKQQDSQEDEAETAHKVCSKITPEPPISDIVCRCNGRAKSKAPHFRQFLLFWDMNEAPATLGSHIGWKLVMSLLALGLAIIVSWIPYHEHQP